MSNYFVSADVDTLLKQVTIDDIRSYLSVSSLSSVSSTPFIVNSYGVFEIAAEPKVSIVIPTNDDIIASLPYCDETHVIDPPGSLSALSWTLPIVADSRVGQIKTFYSTQAVTTLNVSVDGGGTLMGVSLITANPSESYSYQCILTSGSGTWLRLA
jgi:hypothetical protein